MQQVKPPKKPLIFYYCIVLVIMILLNTFLFPSILKQQIEEVDYGTFLNMLDEKEVAVVQVEQDYIYFTDKEEEPTYYRTTTFNSDTSLVDRLYASGCKFGEVHGRNVASSERNSFNCDSACNLYRHRTASVQKSDEENGRRF